MSKTAHIVSILLMLKFYEVNDQILQYTILNWLCVYRPILDFSFCRIAGNIKLYTRLFKHHMYKMMRKKYNYTKLNLGLQKNFKRKKPQKMKNLFSPNCPRFRIIIAYFLQLKHGYQNRDLFITLLYNYILFLKQFWRRILFLF